MNTMNTYGSFSELGSANTKGSDYCVHNSASNPSQTLTPEDYFEFKQMLEDGTLSELVEEAIMKQFSKVLNSTSNDLAGRVERIVSDFLQKTRLNSRRA